MAKPRIVIVGSGGHARVVADILMQNDEFEIAGFTSPAEGDTLYDLPRLGTDSVLSQLPSIGVPYAFPAVGTNRVRFGLIASLLSFGFELPNIISHRANLSPRSRLATGIAIMPGAVVNSGTIIEEGAVINTAATVDHDCRIGPAVHLAPGVHLAGNVTVGEGTFLGVGCSVIPGVKIGRWVTIGAGAAVIRDVGDGVTAVGVPALRFLPTDPAE